MDWKSKKFWLSILSFVFLLGGLFTALILVQRKQLLEKKAAQVSAELSFGVTSFEALNPGDSVDTTIILNPGGQEVVAVDAVINFSKEVLELLSVEPTAKDSSSFKTFAPIVSQEDCSFAPDITGANQTARLSFSAATFDCQADGGKGAVTTPVAQVINPLARLHFKVKDSAASGATASISFYYLGEGETTDSNVVLNPSAETVEDILLAPTSSVSVSVTGESASPSPSPSPGVSPSPSPPPECDESKASCGLSACRDSLCDGGSCWLYAGEEAVGEYADTKTLGCCGDDVGENYICTEYGGEDFCRCCPDGRDYLDTLLRCGTRAEASPSASPEASPSPSSSPPPTASPETKIGDLDLDGDVDEADYAALIAHFDESGTPGEVIGDLDLDGDVDEADYAALIAHFEE